MAKLTFNRSAINAIAKQTKSSGATHLYLVGDHGVYFRSHPGDAPTPWGATRASIVIGTIRSAIPLVETMASKISSWHRSRHG